METRKIIIHCYTKYFPLRQQKSRVKLKKLSPLLVETFFSHTTYVLSSPKAPSPSIHRVSVTEINNEAAQ